MSVFFTTRPDDNSGENTSIIEFLEEYKLLHFEYGEEPSITDALDTTLTIGHYQIWSDGGEGYLVQGDGVGNLGGGLYIISSGAEVTVTQNGSGTVPSEETFVAVHGGVSFIAWALIGEETNVIYFLPHTGKAWYGVLTPPAVATNNADNLTIILLKPDGTYHVKRCGQAMSGNFEFFTHIYDDASPTESEVYFTGKEFDYRPPGLPAGDYVAPQFTYVPD